MTRTTGRLRSDGTDPSPPALKAPSLLGPGTAIDLPAPASPDRHAAGRERSRLRTPAPASSGRRRSTLLWREGRVDVTGTLYRAWRRGRSRPAPEDLTAPLLESPLARLIVFLLDVSDSMSAGLELMRLWIRESMGEAYIRRDPVSVIILQGQGARLLVHPTTSLHFVLDRLREVQVGGATPLDQGLIMARRVVIQWHNRYPVTDLVLISDGRSTASLSGPPVIRAVETIRRLTRSVILINPLPEADPFARELSTFLGANLVSLTSLNREKGPWLKPQGREKTGTWISSTD